MSEGTVFITGANKGIGYATAKAFLQNDFRVVMGVRDMNKGRIALEELSSFGEADLLQIDTSDVSSIREAAKELAENNGNLKILINNAGIAGDRRRRAWEYEPSELLEVYMTDFMGPYELTRQFLPVLDKNGGKVINLVIPVEPMEFFHPFAYQAGKAPLNVLISNFAFEIEKEGLAVQMIGIKPGTVSTDLNNHAQGKFVKTPDQAAELILAAALSNENLNGKIIS